MSPPLLILPRYLFNDFRMDPNRSPDPDNRQLTRRNHPADRLPGNPEKGCDFPNSQEVGRFGDCRCSSRWHAARAAGARLKTLRKIGPWACINPGRERPSDRPRANIGNRLCRVPAAGDGPQTCTLYFRGFCRHPAI